MNATVHNSKKKQSNLEAFLRSEVGHQNCWDVSSVKRDGTVFVRFFSTTEVAAMTHATCFSTAMDHYGLDFLRLDDTKFRVDVDQFDAPRAEELIERGEEATEEP